MYVKKVTFNRRHQFLSDTDIMTPANRLHAILTNFKNGPGNQPVRAMIAKLFSINDSTSPEVFRSYVQVVNLSMEVEQRIRAVPSPHQDLFLRSVMSVQRALASTNIDGSHENLRNNIRAEDLHGLEFCSAMLKDIESEKEIEAETLQQIDKSLGDLIEAIRGSQLEPDFVYFLTSILVNIQFSIKNYRFFGAVGIRTTLARAMGEIILDPHAGANMPAKKNFLTRALDSIKNINALITFYRNGVEVANTLQGVDIHKLMGGP